jgi:nitronate monooxygenase
MAVVKETTPSFLRTPLLDLLGCRLPILLAGMGGVARHRLAAAVCKGGGFGVLGMVREPVTRIQSEIAALRALTSAPFAVNLIPAATPAALLKEQIAACLDLDVSTFVLFWEVDTALVAALKRAGRKVIHQVGNLRDAALAQEAGADALIAQGVEAGGHVRGQVSLFGLLPELVAHSSVPVIASGGIGNGAALLAALALGAQGVSLGTAFLATVEANAHPYHKRRVLSARAEDTLYTTRFARNWHEAAPVRVLSNAVTRGDCDHEPVDTVLGEQDGQCVYLYSTDSPLADATGRVEDMALYCGESCGQLTALTSAGDRLALLVHEAQSCFDRLNRRA